MGMGTGQNRSAAEMDDRREPEGWSDSDIKKRVRVAQAIRQASHVWHVTDRNRRATDPYGRWCGGRGFNPPAYPILHLVFLSEAVEIVAVKLSKNAFVGIQID